MTHMTALDSENVEELRDRLAKRPSFFGGTVSTRLLSAAPGWRPPAPASASKATPQRRPTGNHNAEDTAAPSRGAQQIDRRQQRKRVAQDFNSLDDDSAPSSTPPPSIPKLGDRALAALAAVDKHRGKAPSSVERAAFSAAGPRVDLPSPSGNTKSGSGARVVLPKGKKGAAAHTMAVMPQGQGGLTGRQAADKLMQEKVAELRSRRGTPPLDTIRGLGSVGEGAQGRGRSAPPQLPPAKRRREAAEDDPADDFVVDSDDQAEADWRAEMRSITGYDPSRYGREADDRGMVASRAQIEAEERRSARAGRTEDAADIEAEARLRAAKAAKKARLNKLGRGGDGSVVLAE